MATTLEELQGTPASLDSLADTQPERVQTTPFSDKNKAAHAAILGSGDIAKDFNLAASDMQRGDSAYADGLIDQARIERVSTAREEMYHIMGNPAVSEQEKASAFNSFMALKDEAIDFKEMVKDDAIVSPSQGEAPADEARRLTHAEFMRAEAEYQKEAQQAASEFAAKFDTSGYGQALWEMVSLYFVPIAETEQARNISNAVGAGKMGEGEAVWRLLGESKANVIDMVNSIPADQRMKFTRHLLDVIDQERSILLTGDNQFSAYTWLRDVVDTGYISDTQRYLENAVSIVELLPLIGGPLKGAIRWAGSWIKGTKMPASVLETIGVSNPARTRRLTAAIEADETGEAASALAGVSRDEALADSILPEILAKDAPVRAKIPNQHDVEQLGLRGNEDTIRSATRSGATHFTITEKDQAAAIIVNKFRDAADLRIHSDANQLGRRQDGSVIINAVYGQRDGGWVTANDAIDQMKFTFRQFGVREEDLTVLRLQEDGYHVMSKDALRASIIDRTDGDFRVALNMEYPINPTDIGAMARFSVKYNIFDRLAPGLSQGKLRLQRNILDPSSMLDPQMVKPALAAVDRAAGIESSLLDMGKEFNAIYRGLPAEHKELVSEFIFKSNRDGLQMNATELSGAGHTRNTIAALRKWREYWDTQYILENRDLSRSLKGQGFQIIEDGAGGNRLFARPMVKNRSNNIVFDTIQNRRRVLSDVEIDQLYDRGGFVARLRDNVMADVENVMVRNTKGNFIRQLTDSDTVLHYRPGYYTVQYKNPVFVQRNVLDELGNNTGKVKVVANAKDHPTAQRFLEAQAARDGVAVEEWGSIRGDLNEVRIGTSEYWDVNTAGGRTAQRFRGQRLEDIDSNVNQVLDQSHIMGPVDSMMSAARSLAERISLRDWLETSKQRFVQQYGDLLTSEKGRVQFPRSPDELQVKGQAGSKEVADARTTYEYIRYMESGYVNSLDDAHKAAFRGMANIVGRAGFGASERTLGWMADQRPTGFMKNVSFRAYLSTNPLRQLLIQSHQAVQLFAIEPTRTLSVLTKQAPAIGLLLRMSDRIPDAKMKAALEVLGGMPFTELRILADIVDNSGIMKAVDRTNLLDGELKYMADSMQTSANPLMRAGGAVEGTLRTVGFDLGEQYNLLTSFLTFYDRNRRAAVAAGKPEKVFDNELIDNALGQARSFTYGMNRAGDMPYNQNSFGMIMQFFQVPHKAMLAMTLNRNLTKGEKAQLIALNSLMYGIPAYAVANWLDWAVGDNPEAKEALIDGVEGYAMNKALEWTFNEPTRIDWKGLAPLDMYGALETITTLWTDGLGEALTKSPPGQLWFGSNPRITNAMRRTAAFFNDSVNGVAEPRDVMSVMDSWLSISSGYSNFMRSRMALEKGKLFNSSSTYLMDDSISTPEAYAVALGFSTYDSAVEFAIGKRTYESRVELEADVKQLYNDVKRTLANDDMTIGDKDFHLSAINLIWNQFEPETEVEARKMLLTMLSKDVRRGDHNVFVKAMQASGIMSNDDYSALVESMNLPEETKQLLLSAKRNVEDG